MTGKSMSMSGKSPDLNHIADTLRRRITDAGSIGFDEFMAHALYSPHGGYYAAAKGRTGRQGDFFTSVSLGPLFGRLLAAQFTQMWRALGEAEDFLLIEQGANDGQLLDDILTALERDTPSWRPTAFIVEPLAMRRQVQEQTLRRWSPRVQWVAHEKELPAFTGAFFANELLDAFPIRLLTRLDGHWHERRVGLEQGKFVFLETPLTETALLHVAQAWPLDPNIRRFDTEWCPSLSGWMHTLAQKLHRGWMLLVDYGHPASARFHAARAGGSLAAYRNHARQDDPLDCPGEQDITAHVDFTATAQAGIATGLEVAGFTDQHHALAALAAAVFPPMAMAPLSADKKKEMRVLRQLLHPESMGTSFKFLALAKGINAPLISFRFARDAQRELFAM